LCEFQTCQPAGTENLEILKKGGPKTWRSQKKTWRFIYITYQSHFVFESVADLVRSGDQLHMAYNIMTTYGLQHNMAIMADKSDVIGVEKCCTIILEFILYRE